MRGRHGHFVEFTVSGPMFKAEIRWEVMLKTILNPEVTGSCLEKHYLLLLNA